MAIEVFCCYSRRDQQLLQDLKAHLTLFQRQGLLTLWCDTNIDAGVEWEKEIEKHIDTADIILLLVSSDFMASDYCYSKEMKRALERHEHKEARLVPIILRPVHWQKAPFAKLQALPTNAKPVIDRYWHTPDEALSNIAEGILNITEELIESLAKKAFENAEKSLPPQYSAPHPSESTLPPKLDTLLNAEIGTVMKRPALRPQLSSNQYQVYNEHVVQGYNLQLKGEYDEAMQEYRIVIRNAPELLHEVISNLLALLKLAPRYTAGYRVLGDAYMRQAEFLKAMDAYNKALISAKKAKTS